MTPDQDKPTTTPGPNAPRERCAGCAATLVEDQRYCLQCGARRGKPRVDFTAFWGSSSSARQSYPTGVPRKPGETQGSLTTGGKPWLGAGGPRLGAGGSQLGTRGSRLGTRGSRLGTRGSRLGTRGSRLGASDPQPGTRRPRPGGGDPWLGGGTPSRRVTGTLVAFVLAAGILAGVALGPGPASSPAEDSTLAQRVLAALVAQASDSRSSTPTSPTASPGEGDDTTTSPASTAPSKVKSKQPSASSKASAPSSSESSSSNESSAGAPSTEGSDKGSVKDKPVAPGTPVKLPPIKHVWLIALSGESLNAAASNPTADPYLSKQLAPKGMLLNGYTLSTNSELGNGIALLSGQNVNLDTEQNCPSYIELEPPTISPTNGLAEGVGCVYPTAVKTLADELTAAGLTWKAYVQGMQGNHAGGDAPATSPGTNVTLGAGSPTATNATTSTGSPTATNATTSTGSPTSTNATASDGSPVGGAPTPNAGAQTQPPASPVTCQRPELGSLDPNHAPLPGDPYLTFRNPFVYFHSLLDDGSCTSDDVDLTTLQGDLVTPTSTPSLSWIVPSACDDGSTTPCAAGAAAGPGAADGFLKEVVPQILATAAYREGGLIAIVPDSAPISSATATAKPLGALLISPFVHNGAHVSENLNDFSLLKSLTRLFGVLPLGHANDPSTVSFGATVYRTTK